MQEMCLCKGEILRVLLPVHMLSQGACGQGRVALAPAAKLHSTLWKVVGICFEVFSLTQQYCNVVKDLNGRIGNKMNVLNSYQVVYSIYTHVQPARRNHLPHPMRYSKDLDRHRLRRRAFSKLPNKRPHLPFEADDDEV